MMATLITIKDLYGICMSGSHAPGEEPKNKTLSVFYSTPTLDKMVDECLASGQVISKAEVYRRGIVLAHREMCGCSP
jgi:hypothetical protein